LLTFRYDLISTIHVSQSISTTTYTQSCQSKAKLFSQVRLRFFSLIKNSHEKYN